MNEFQINQLKKYSPKMWEYAISQNPELIEYIPKKYITQEISNKAFSKNKKFIKYIPPEFFNQQMWEYIIEKIPKLIEYTPKKFINKKISNLVLSYDIILIKYIPKEFTTQNIWNKAIKKSPKLIEYIPKSFITQEICDTTFFKDPTLIKYIPKEFISKNIADYVYLQNPTLLHYLPQTYINQKRNENLVLSEPQFITLIPKEQLTKETCLKLIYQNPNNIRYIPKEFITEELLIQLILQKEELINIIPEEFIKEKLCLKLIKINPTLINIIPENIKNKKVNSNYTLLEYIIINELEYIINHHGTLENIIKKYELPLNKINSTIEKIKEIDIQLYTKIKNKLLTNQKNWIINMHNDCRKLTEIILSLGNTNSNALNKAQKIKFAYLYKKYITNSLDEIYSFLINRNNLIKEYNILICFYKNILNYHKINDILTLPEIITNIKVNNKWLEDFNKPKYLSINNGLPTSIIKYKEQETNIEVIDNIINVLKKEHIPLNDIIVKEAIRQHFDGTLHNFISNLKSYDKIIEKNQSKTR